MKIFDYMKANPWTTGALVIGGGLTFIVLSGWFSGGGGGGVTVAAPSGPSEDAQLAFASLQAQQQMAGQQTSAQVAVAGIQAELAKFMTDRETGVALAQIMAGKDIASSEIGASRDMFSMQTQTSYDIAALNTSVQTRSIDSSTYLEDRQITSNENIITKLLDAFKPQTPAPVKPPPVEAVAPSLNPWERILQDRPDVLSEYYRASSTADKNSPVYTQKGLDGPENFARYWYTQMGGASEYGALKQI